MLEGREYLLERAVEQGEEALSAGDFSTVKVTENPYYCLLYTSDAADE